MRRERDYRFDAIRPVVRHKARRLVTGHLCLAVKNPYLARHDLKQPCVDPLDVGLPGRYP